MSMHKGQKAPRTMTGGLRARAWWVLRKNRSMTLAELMLTVCDGEEKDAKSNLRGWLNKQVYAGLLTRERVEDGKLTSNGSYRYTLGNSQKIPHTNFYTILFKIDISYKHIITDRNLEHDPFN